MFFVISSLFFGLILGPLARLLIPGRQPIGIGWTILAGFLGALIGGIIATALGFGDLGFNIDWVRLAIQVVCAVLAVLAVVAWKQSSRRSA